MLVWYNVTNGLMLTCNYLICLLLFIFKNWNYKAFSPIKWHSRILKLKKWNEKGRKEDKSYWQDQERGPCLYFHLKKNCCIGLIYNVAEFGNILFLRFPLVIAYYIFHCYFWELTNMFSKILLFFSSCIFCFNSAKSLLYS